MAHLNDFRKFLKKNYIDYKNIALYEEALTHSSFYNENKNNSSRNSYERLEFLGDAILGQFVSEYLFRNFPNYNQGQMTMLKHAVIKKEFLSEVGKKLKIEKYIFLGAGEDRNNITNSIYEDVIEALIAAIYLDLGYNAVKEFIDKNISSEINNISLEDAKDPKTILQELLQSEKRGVIKYDTKDLHEKDNKDKKFISSVSFDGNVLGQGKGKSKQEAERNAAINARKRMAS